MYSKYIVYNIYLFYIVYIIYIIIYNIKNIYTYLCMYIQVITWAVNPPNVPLTEVPDILAIPFSLLEASAILSFSAVMACAGSSRVLENW